MWLSLKNFVECGSFLESNSPDILVLCKANLDDSIDSLQFLFDGLSPFNRKGSYYLYAWLCSLCKGMASFSMGLISRKLYRFLLMFYFAQCLTLFWSVYHLLCLYAQFLILIHLTYLLFSWSTHLLWLSFKTLMSIIRTD